MSPHSEDATQIAIIEWLQAVLPHKEIVHIPNTPRSRSHGARLKRLGLRTGAADLLVFLPNRVVAIEVKRPAVKAIKQRAGSPSDAQIEFGGQMNALGHGFMVAYGVDDVKRGLAALGIETREAGR